MNKAELKWGQKILVKGKHQCLCEPEQIEAFKRDGWSDPDEVKPTVAEKPSATSTSSKKE